jgi:hypothetical protein
LGLLTMFMMNGQACPANFELLKSKRDFLLQSLEGAKIDAKQADAFTNCVGLLKGL